MLALQAVHILGLCCQGVNGLLHFYKLLFPSFPTQQLSNLSSGRMWSLRYNKLHTVIVRSSPISLLGLFVLHLLLRISLGLGVPGMQLAVASLAVASPLVLICCMGLLI